MINTTNMSQEEKAKTIQGILLPMMDEIIKIFEENNIWYSLTAGTLLGAERHAGFIPWDDDIDIDIMYKDMDRIVDALDKNLSHNYYVQTIDKNKDATFFFPRVLDKRYPISYAKNNITQNIFIDLFAITRVKKAKKPLSLILWHHYLTARNNNNLPLWVRVVKIPLKIIPVHVIVNAFKNKLNDVAVKDGEYILWTNKDVSKANYVKTIDVESILFENREVNVYVNRRDFLKSHYGLDFMSQPNPADIPTIKYDLIEV